MLLFLVFEKFPLITQKHVDFELFKKVIQLMEIHKHLTEDGLQQIVNNAISMNLTTQRIARLKLAFPPEGPEGPEGKKLSRLKNFS